MTIPKPTIPKLTIPSPTYAVGQLTRQQLAAAIEQSLLDCCRFCLAASEGTQLHEDPDALWFLSGVPFPLYNGIYRPHFADLEGPALDAALGHLLTPFKEERVPMVLCTGPLSQGQPLHDAIRRQKLWKVATTPGMAIDLHQLDASWANPEGLTITRVSDEEALRAWVALQNDCFEFPAWVADATFRMTRETLPTAPTSGAQDADRVRLYLGTYHGVPVATSMLVESEETVGIFNVACAPEARHRGFGAAMTAAPLLKARDAGHRIGVLHATPMGLPVYQKMGFATYCELDQYLYAPLGTIASVALASIARKIANWWRGLTRKLPA